MGRGTMGGSTVNLGEALEIYDQWISDPRVAMTSEPRNTEPLSRTAVEPFVRQPATKAIADCYLVALAQAVGVWLVPRGFAKYLLRCWGERARSRFRTFSPAPTPL